ncbi:hypothetical protein [Myroides injenensis]|uniref:hypothetical protein n=1 Tax=Myroides injenensis TaxID=1183151 RepID=UPI00226F0BAD|nr:hypothetical protein [Myroides injenensis]
MVNKIIWVAMGLAICLAGCKDKESHNENKEVQVSDTINKVNQQSIIKDKEFIEGALIYNLTIKDSLLSNYISTVASDPLHFDQMKDQFITNLLPEQKVKFESFKSLNHNAITQLLLLPFLKNEIYVAGYEVVYKNKGVFSVTELKWNDILDQGYGYVYSPISESQLNFPFSKELIKAELFQTVIDSVNYEIEELQEESSIANYKVNKKVYTKKEYADNHSPRYLPPKITVYYSDAFNGVINKVMPFAIDIPQGVLKMEIQYFENESYEVVFEAERIVNRKLVELETGVLSTKAFFPVNEEKDVLPFEMRLSKILALPKM